MNILRILGKGYTAKRIALIERGINRLRDKYRTHPQENLEEEDLDRCRHYASQLIRIDYRASSRGLANYVIEGKADELSRKLHTFKAGFVNGRQSILNNLQRAFGQAL